MEGEVAEVPAPGQAAESWVDGDPGWRLLGEGRQAARHDYAGQISAQFAVESERRSTVTNLRGEHSFPKSVAGHQSGVT
jgi:hypothetical protein